MPGIVVLSATRTPLGSFQGALSRVPAWGLGAAAIRGALEAARVGAGEVSDAIMGSVLLAGQGQAPARQAALAAGLPRSVRTVTVNKVCGSGMQAVMQASQLLAAGAGSYAVAGGMETMSLAPYLLPKARDGYRLGHQQVVDSMIADGLWDPYGNVSMGECAEACAARYQFSREQQDAYAIESFLRANAAQKDGCLAAEITPVDLPGAPGATGRVALDEVPAKVVYDRVPHLKPSFRKDGTITPANASAIADGAAALVLATAEGAGAAGLAPIARLVSFGAHGQDPLWFTTAPVQAARNALASAGWRPGDVDLWEVNEAFAVVPMAFAAEMSVPRERLNVRGGAISLGHPIGASGARILVTLIAAMRERGAARGLAAVCIGGGEALAACVELA
jgi:acetyl-CoA C-acetyltransferase